MDDTFHIKENQVFPPQAVCLVITERCNAKCIYCPYSNQVLPTLEDPPVEVLMNLIRESADYGVSEIRFSGGEPFLSHHLTQYIREATRLGMRSSFVTNGSLLNDERIEDLSKTGITAMVVSIDSLIPETYEYCRGLPYTVVLNALRSFQKIKSNNTPIWVGITVVITKFNIGELSSMTRLFTELQIPVQFQPCHNFLNAGENDYLIPEVSEVDKVIEEIMDLKQKGYLVNNSNKYLMGIPKFFRNRKLPLDFPCPIPSKFAIFDWNLSLRPCCFLEPISIYSTTHSLKQLWISDSMMLVRENVTNGECPGCWLLFLDTWK